MRLNFFNIRCSVDISTLSRTYLFIPWLKWADLVNSAACLVLGIIKTQEQCPAAARYKLQWSSAPYFLHVINKHLQLTTLYTLISNIYNELLQSIKDLNAVFGWSWLTSILNHSFLLSLSICFYLHIHYLD